MKGTVLTATFRHFTDTTCELQNFCVKPVLFPLHASAGKKPQPFEQDRLTYSDSSFQNPKVDIAGH